MNISLSSFAPKNLVSRERFGGPACVSLLVLHTQAESGAYSRDSSSGDVHFVYTTIRHRVSPAFIRSCNLVPMTFTAESPSAQGQ